MKKYQKMGFFHRLFTFSGYSALHEFWSDIGIRVISFLCAVILMCIAVAAIVPGTTEEILAIVNALVPVLAVLWLIPMVALTRRRLRDAGQSPKVYFWLLLPVIGWIIFIVALCKPTQERKTNRLADLF